jgi:LmbE family N-acetylglucosaminyl deacetylase
MKCLIVTAHPDDAEISMGGTISKLVGKGHKIKNYILSIPNMDYQRSAETKNSSSYLGIEYEFCNFPHSGRIEDVKTSELISKLDYQIKMFAPDIIFTHWDKDSHQDHRAVSRAVLSTSRNHKCDIYFFEQINQCNVIFSSKFDPNTYVDISDYFNNKLNAVEFHQSQLKGYMGHYLKDVKDLARWRGSQLNVKYAESFKVVYKKELI